MVQGKIPVTSSHRYRSSNTVGRMSETLEAKKFKPRQRPILIPKCDDSCGTELKCSSNHDVFNILQEPKELLVTEPVKEASSVREAFEAKFAEFRESLNVKLPMNMRRRRQRAFQKFMCAYAARYSVTISLHCPFLYWVFMLDFSFDKDYVVKEEYLDKLDSYIQSLCPDINLSVFPELCPLTVYELQEAHKELHGKIPEDDSPKYIPQSGSLHGSCSDTAYSAVKSCSKVFLDGIEEVPTLFNVVTESVSSYFVQKESSIQGFFLVFLCFFAYRLINDMMALVSFIVGTILAGNIRNANKILYSPQAGALSSDDGALFTGIKSRVKQSTPNSDKPNQGLGVKVSYGMKTPQQSNNPPPGFPPKTKDLGRMNGFAAGI